VLTTIFQAYLGRIEEVNGILKAVTEVNPDALAIAAALDAERCAGTLRGYDFREFYQTVLATDESRPLHGIPILLKNNIATDDKMNNTGEPLTAEIYLDTESL